MPKILEAVENGPGNASSSLDQLYDDDDESITPFSFFLFSLLDLVLSKAWVRFALSCPFRQWLLDKDVIIREHVDELPLGS